mmetsp:Transcript_18277/g.20996  ORF Transcript_18277/g.20996 Transcript_18277/m.20996 type:complete len:226 (-) Transcript_18277:2-679(-)
MLHWVTDLENRDHIVQRHSVVHSIWVLIHDHTDHDHDYDYCHDLHLLHLHHRHSQYLRSDLICVSRWSSRRWVTIHSRFHLLSSRTGTINRVQRASPLVSVHILPACVRPWYRYHRFDTNQGRIHVAPPRAVCLFSHPREYASHTDPTHSPPVPSVSTRPKDENIHWYRHGSSLLTVVDSLRVVVVVVVVVLLVVLHSSSSFFLLLILSPSSSQLLFLFLLLSSS